MQAVADPNPNPNPNPKKIYGEFSNVLLSEEDHTKLEARFGGIDTKAKIENLSQYIESKDTKYKSHYATILQWAAREKGGTDGQPRQRSDHRTDASDHPKPPGKYAHLGTILETSGED